jgi:peptidoglycan/xylan/chitin deacetylase (PgdA/CDA1 family)
MRSLAGDVLRRRDGELALRRARAIAESRRPKASDDPFDTFDLLMDASERAGLRSTFYVQSGGRHAFNGPTYDIGDPRVGRLLRRIGERGHTIGLHGSYQSFVSAERIRAELDRLVQACRDAGIEQSEWGMRQHYLRFATPQTWRAQEAAGVVSDSTLGYADATGFRASTCREYPVFDLELRQPLRLREHSLTVMDVTLLSYLGLDHQTVSTRTQEIVRRCRAHGGEAIVCFHNSSLPRRRDQAIYRDLVARLADDLR